MIERSQIDYTKELLDYPETIRRCVAIFFYGRSASYLLSSFLDGHPHVLQLLPTAMQQFFFRLDFGELPSRGSVDSFTEDVTNLMPQLFGTFVGNTRVADRDRFKAYLARSIRSLRERRVTLEAGVLCSAIHVAHQAALEMPTLTKDPVVVAQLHVPSDQRFKFARTLYPQARFLYSIRNPAQTLNSYFRHHLFTVPHRPFSYLTRGIVEQVLATADLPAAESPATAAGVRFEDLHTRTEPAMRAVAKWIGIPWAPVLLESTFNGEPWWYDRGDVKFNGAFPDQARAKPTPYLPFLDRLRIGKVLRGEHAAWGYENAYERLSPLARKLFDRFAFDLPTAMEFAALRVQLRELLAQFVDERKTIVEFIRHEQRRREGEAFRVLPVIRPGDG
ncbi:MAG: sulfotransferase [Candidatus Eremiobacteraeota bacterium]|nr:sulfotransferase [Candidatus Eremiobacteraeota bacterium]